MKLLIVESPGKVKKLQEFLGSDWKVTASVGHIRDLPDKDYGLEPPAFVARYVVTKEDVVKRLGALIKQADEIYLASDPDREGEAIAWHIKDQFHLQNCKRVTYHAITREDVAAGIAAPREIDMNLVHAQEARRGLDRLVGWHVSSPLSAAISEKASAGRVQSPAVRLVVEREREIKAFVPVTHYGVDLAFAGGWKAAWLPKEGWLGDNQEYFLDKNLAQKVADVRDLEVIAFEEKDNRVAPPAPFTTSSLQQAASNALKFKPKKTMELAQKLYEAGHITYMRTDSPNLSHTAIEEIRAYAESRGLPLPQTPRTFKSKAGAQEAHEAIRPTHIEVEDITLEGDFKPDFIRDAAKLYRLIRIRALASQLADAVYSVRVARLAADVDGKQAVFEAKGRTLLEKGWKEVLESDQSEEKDIEPDNPVPELASSDHVAAESGSVLTRKTKPKPRFKDATLIRELEKSGIGRPATYASILDNITSREYLKEEKGYLVPTPIGEKIVDALKPAFTFIDLDFTRSMENALDDVAAGKMAYSDCMAAMYDDLHKELKAFSAGHIIACPACGDTENFRHLKNAEKGYNYWKCRACDASFDDDNGKPGRKREKPSLTDFACGKCGKPLKHIKTDKYDFFACSNDACKATYDNVDGKPVTHKTDEITKFKCKKCGKPLAIHEWDNATTGKHYRKFRCTNYPNCKVGYWIKDDGTPNYDKPLD